MTPHEPRLLWTERMGPRPLCDVPWFGNAIIMSDGTVNFCCHSNGVAGNVNETPFEEIWNGEVMRGIRKELAAQTLPIICQTPSCPIHRGDTRHFLLDRSGRTSSNPMTIGQEVRAMVAKWFRASHLQARRTERFLRAPIVDLSVHIEYTGPHAFAADLLVGVASPGGPCLFVPSGRPAPEPVRYDIGLHHGSSHVIEIPSVKLAASGASEICAALFIANANPLAANQCLWAEVLTV